MIYIGRTAKNDYCGLYAGYKFDMLGLLFPFCKHSELNFIIVSKHKHCFTNVHNFDPPSEKQKQKTNKIFKKHFKINVIIYLFKKKMSFIIFQLLCH